MKAGWEVKPLKELCHDYKQDIVDGPFGANLKREHYTIQGTPVLKIQNIKPFEIVLKRMDFVDDRKTQELSRHSYRSNDIIITKLGQPLGVSAIVENIPDGIIVADLVRVRAAKIDTKFLCYQLNSPMVAEHLNSLQKGMTRPRVQISAVRDLPVSYPPLEEQKRIVAVLDAAFEGLTRAKENAETNLQNARELFEATLDKCLVKDAKDWPEYELASLGKITTGGTPKSSDADQYGDALPFIKPGHFQIDGSLNYDDVGLSSAGVAGARLVAKNSAVMVCIGATIGKSGYCDRSIATNQQINALTPNDKLHHYFAYLHFLTPTFQTQVLSNSGQATLPIINKTKWGKLKIKVPTDMITQQSIVDRMTEMRANVDLVADDYAAKLTDIADLRQSLLQKAFAGELT